MSLSCKAQNIVPYDSDQDIYIPNSGDYYKDTNDFFNTFEGEWKWEDNANNSALTLILEKETAINDGSGYTYDLLIGEYQYIANGIELANTLDDLANPNIEDEQHNIQGINIITKYNHPQCTDCLETEKRLQVSIEHDEYEGIEGRLIMRFFVENGVDMIHLIVKDGPNLSIDPNAPDNIDIPFGEYILIKQ